MKSRKFSRRLRRGQKITRAGIRLPRGQPAQTFITVVNNPDQTDTTPTVLGTIRTPAATIFSWDVAVQKARTAVFFSVACAKCHDVAKSSDTADVIMPAKAACVECHSPKGKVASNCSFCHSYHAPIATTKLTENR